MIGDLLQHAPEKSTASVGEIDRLGHLVPRGGQLGLELQHVLVVLERVGRPAEVPQDERPLRVEHGVARMERAELREELPLQLEAPMELVPSVRGLSPDGLLRFPGLGPTGRRSVEPSALDQESLQGPGDERVGDGVVVTVRRTHRELRGVGLRSQRLGHRHDG